MKNGIIIGFALIFIGISLAFYYNQYKKPAKEAEKMLNEAKLIFEQGDRDSINDSINIFRKVIAQYPETNAEKDSYYFIARSYEKLGLNRLAYLKYSYLLKNYKDISADIEKETKARLARLNVLRSQTEEGIDKLLGLLHLSDNRDFRSRVYTELGHTYLKLGEYKKSKRMFDIALSEDGNNEDAILGKARALKRMGYANNAYDTYEHFLKYYGNFSTYARDVRYSYIRQVYSSGYHSYIRGNYYAAISFFRRILIHFPEHVKAENSFYWIGESYLALKKYDSAINNFSRVLENSYHHKDEDARMKLGYTYFLSGRYDLAAREFQVYLNEYPHGKYVSIVNKWKSSSTKEILDRIQNKIIPEIEDKDIDEGAEKKDKHIDSPEKVDKDKSDNNKLNKENKENKENIEEKVDDNKKSKESTNLNQIEYENVAEL